MLDDRYTRSLMSELLQNEQRALQNNRILCFVQFRQRINLAGENQWLDHHQGMNQNVQCNFVSQQLEAEDEN